MGHRLTPGRVVQAMTLEAVDGETLAVPDPDKLVHLQFRRFAGCPLCNLHLRSFVRRHDELEAAGVREVVFFHSSAAQLCAHTQGLPFPVVGDETKYWYGRFGVESGRRALLDRRVWGKLIAAVTRSLLRIVLLRDRAPSLRQPHGRLGLPADFLIAADGHLLAVKYGEHAYDQWSVDDVLRLAVDAPSAASRVRA